MEFTLKIDKWLSRRAGTENHLDDKKYLGGYTNAAGQEPLPWRYAAGPDIVAGTAPTDSYNQDSQRVVCLMMSTDGTVGGYAMQKADGTDIIGLGPSNPHVSVSGFCTACAYDDVFLKTLLLFIPICACFARRRI